MRRSPERPPASWSQRRCVTRAVVPTGQDAGVALTAIPRAIPEHSKCSIDNEHLGAVCYRGAEHGWPSAAVGRSSGAFRTIRDLSRVHKTTINRNAPGGRDQEKEDGYAAGWMQLEDDW